MSWKHIVVIAVVFAVVVVIVVLVTEVIPRRMSKRRHARHLDQLFQFDHLRSDGDAEEDKPDRGDGGVR